MFSTLLFPSSSAFTKRSGTNLWSSVFSELSIAFGEEEDEDVYLISMGNVNRQRLLYQQEDVAIKKDDEEENRAAQFFLWACLWREIEEQWMQDSD